MKKFVCLLTLATAVAAPAFANVITFESFAIGAVVSGSNKINSDLTLVSLGGSSIVVAGGPNGNHGALENLPRSGYRVDFNVSGISSISVDLGDFASDSENIYLQAYDSSNNLLASSTAFLPSSLVGYTTLSVNAANIQYILFGGDAGNQGFLNSVYLDNLTYNLPASSAVPDSGASIMLFGASLGVIAGLRRRRS